MSLNLNSLKGIIYGTTIGVIKGATRSLDYSSYNALGSLSFDTALCSLRC